MKSDPIHQLPDALTVSAPVDGSRRRRRSPGPKPARSGPPATTSINPAVLRAAQRLQREGEAMRAVSPDVIILSHPGSAAYVRAHRPKAA